MTTPSMYTLSGSARLFALSLTLAAFVAAPSAATKSSHREAPLNTEMPKVDATDFYMFSSYQFGRSDYVTLIANYIPLQDGYGGPNYFTMDPDALYEIHVDNDGDAVEDLTFRFEFKNVLRDIALDIGPSGNTKSVSIPLRQAGQVFAGANGALNELERYTVSVVQGPSQGGGPVTPITNASNGNRDFVKPVDNIGNKTIPNYDHYANQYVYEITLPDGSLGRMFVGQRKDPFVVNLGETFDLVNTNPLGPVDGELDDLADKNVTSLILEIPKSYLHPAGGGGDRIVGAWTSASLPAWRQLKERPTYKLHERTSARFRQVSRLGKPLVNVVVIGLHDNVLFNASHPSQDVQFLDYVTHPTLPALLEILFPVTAPTAIPRNDLVAVFLTGVPGLNANGSTAEMLRLNLETPATLAPNQNNLGVLGGDAAGFPNGRRPGDDVVDAALRVVMGVLLPMADAPSGQLPFTDGAYVDASFFGQRFPYLRTPLSGSPN
jgi:hypothetical protein